MNFSIQDIEVLVLTHKRPDFLKEALASYRQQTLQGFRLAVFSNGDCPEVKEIANHYQAELFYEENEIGMYPNILRAVQNAERKLTILAHDDDLIESTYLENILKLFNAFPDLALVISRQESLGSPVTDTQKNKCILFNTPAEWAAYIFTGENFSFSSFCAKTEHIKKLSIEVNENYGKVADVPFMFQTLKNGDKSAVIAYPFVRYRLHEGQDCQDYASGPTAEQWLNLTGFYKNIFSVSRKMRLFFSFQNFRHVRIGWKDWCKCEYDKMSYSQYISLALKKGVLSYGAIFLGSIIRGKFSHFLQKKILNFSLTTFSQSEDK